MIHDLPSSAYPFTIRFLDPETGRPLSPPITVSGPGAVDVPGLGRAVRVRITWADGTAAEVVGG